MNEIDLKTAYAGDIVSISGVTGTVGHTLNEIGKKHVIPSIPIDPPIISFSVTFNDSPLKGKDGDKLTIAQIRDRLVKESEDDVSLKVEIGEKVGTKVVVSGRGDLHLGILIEKMRREGYEMQITPPEVVCQIDPDTKAKLEPYEEVKIDVALDYVADIVENLNSRKGMLMDVLELNDGN